MTPLRSREERKQANRAIRELMKSYPNRTEVADKLGTSCAVVSRWYLGISLPSKESFEKLKAAYPYLLEIING